MDGSAATAVPRRRRRKQCAWLRRQIRFVKRKKAPILMLGSFLLLLSLIGMLAERPALFPAMNSAQGLAVETPVAQPLPKASAVHLLKTEGLTSLADLAQWCNASHAAAATVAELLAGSGFVQAPRNSLLRFPVTSRPVCLSRGSVYLAEGGVQHAGNTSALASALGAKRISVRPLLDDFFFAQRAAVTAVPAMALLVQGDFIANHAFHLLHDVLEGLWTLLHTFKEGALLHVPRQTVLFRSQRTDWTTGITGTARVAGQGTSKGTALSAKLLDAFSSAPTSAGTDTTGDDSFFYPSSLVFEHDEVVGPGSPPPASVPAHCFCQGMLVSSTTPAMVPAEAYDGIRRAIARHFPVERSYDVHFSDFAVEEEDRRRRRLPFGPQHWREGAAGGTPKVESEADHHHHHGAYRPRALFLHRIVRTVAEADVYVRMLRAAGFRVEEVYAENLSVEEQFHLGRYADLVVGMHGLGLIHGFWMDPSPVGCRAVLEFLPYVHIAFPVQFHLLFGRHTNMSFHRVAPVDVRFGPQVKDAEAEKARLMSIRSVVSVPQFPSFANQACIYNHTQVLEVIQGIARHLAACLYPPEGAGAPTPST